MKTAIKLVLIYFLLQFSAVFIVMPFTMLYAYIVKGSAGAASDLMLAPTMLVGFISMSYYLWKQGYLKEPRKIWAPISISFLIWSIIIGFSTIFLIDAFMSQLTFLPNWLEDTFDLLQSGWLGILCIAILGPILEEVLFRGAITKVLLQKYNPTKAIIISALIFGIVHINPVQVVGAAISGLLFAWIYYKTGSLIHCTLIHIMNNSLSVFISLRHPDEEHISDLLGEPSYMIALTASVALFILSWWMIKSYRISNIKTVV